MQLFRGLIPTGFCWAATAILILLLSIAGTASAAPDAAGTLVGSWSGSGRINYADGTSEGISCSAYYTGGGRELTIAIQCRSERNPIHIRSRLQISGNRASGAWEERTFNASGTATGTIGANSISLNVSGGGFTGTMSVAVRQSSHNVTISTQGIAMSRATMALNRR